MKTTWSRMLVLSAALAALSTSAGAADGWPVVLPGSAARNEPQRIALPVGGQSSSGRTDRSTIGFVNVSNERVSSEQVSNEQVSNEHSAEAQSNDRTTRAPAPVYRRPASKRADGTPRRISTAEPRQIATEEASRQLEAIPLPATKRASSVKMAVPRLMAEASPAQLDDQASPLDDHNREPQTSRRRRGVTSVASTDPVSTDSAERSNPNSHPQRLRVVNEPAAPMALATDDVTQRIPPVTEETADAPRLLTNTPDQFAAARPMSGPMLRRAPLADRLSALQDQVPASYVGIQGRVGAINLGDRTVKLNFDRRQPPPLGGVVKVYQAQKQGTTCVGALKIVRVYGGIATGSPVGDLKVERLMSGDLAVFHVGSDVSATEPPDPSEVIWVSDRIRTVRR